MANEKKTPNNTVELQPQDSDGIKSDKTYIEELETEVDNLTGEVDELTENLDKIVNANTVVGSYDSGNDSTTVSFCAGIQPTQLTITLADETEKTYKVNEDDMTEYVNINDPDDIAYASTAHDIVSIEFEGMEVAGAEVNSFDVVI